MVTLLLFIFSCIFLSSINIASTTTNITSANFLSNIIGSFIRGRNGINITRFLSTFQLPSCMEQCVPEIDGLLTALSKSDNNGDFAEICSELQSATYCTSSAECSKIFIEATASAYQFICLDNIQAISESIQCVKTAVMDSQPDCDVHCSVYAPSLHESSNRSSEEMFQLQHVCNATRCLLSCFKTMIDNKCQLDRRNLLDSLLSAVVRGGYHGTESTLDWIMPESCQINVNTYKNRLNLSDSSHSFWVSNVSSHRSFLEVENTETASNESVFRTETASENILGENAVEAVLLIAGETRTLRYQMFDRQGNPVPIPDLRSLYQILEDHFLPKTTTSEYVVDRVVLLPEQKETRTGSRYETTATSDTQMRSEGARKISFNDTDETKRNESEKSRNRTKVHRKKSTVVVRKTASSISSTILTTAIFSWIHKLIQTLSVQ